MIPISSVQIDERIERSVVEVLRSGQLAQGEHVERFEAEFARQHGVSHAIAVNNGTTALVLAMQALGIGPGDEVITTPFTFIATLNAILEAGATAVFADVGDDFNIDADEIASRVTDRTKAIMPVHLYGRMVDMGSVMTIADRRGLAVVEDAAQAIGATFEGRPAGSFGVGCFSLYATKNVTTGEGGVVTTSDDALADRMRLLRNQGMRRRYEYEVAGHNYRMTNVAAAIGLPQLERLDEISSTRRRNADLLRARLEGIRGLVPPAPVGPDRTHVYHQFTVEITDDAVVGRDEFVDRVTAAGVGCGVYYPRLVHDYDCYRTDRRVQVRPTPRAARAARRVASLPVHPGLSDSDIEQITETVRSTLAT